LVIFWLEIAEIFRRWMWVFIRVEWESLRRNTQGEGVSAGTAEKPTATVEFDAGEDEESYEMLSSQESFGGRR
jgi:hypothetical protein